MFAKKAWPLLSPLATKQCILVGKESEEKALTLHRLSGGRLRQA